MYLQEQACFQCFTISETTATLAGRVHFAITQLRVKTDLHERNKDRESV